MYPANSESNQSREAIRPSQHRFAARLNSGVAYAIGRVLATASSRHGSQLWVESSSIEAIYTECPLANGILLEFRTHQTTTCQVKFRFPHFNALQVGLQQAT
jgi:hypothetical protein